MSITTTLFYVKHYAMSESYLFRHPPTIRKRDFRKSPFISYNSLQSDRTDPVCNARPLRNVCNSDSFSRPLPHCKTRFPLTLVISAATLSYFSVNFCSSSHTISSFSELFSYSSRIVCVRFSIFMLDLQQAATENTSQPDKQYTNTRNPDSHFHDHVHNIHVFL